MSAGRMAQERIIPTHFQAALEAMDTCAAETSEEAGAGLDVVAPQLRKGGIDENEVELAAQIEWYMPDLSQTWLSHAEETGSGMSLSEWAKGATADAGMPPVRRLRPCASASEFLKWPRRRTLPRDGSHPREVLTGCLIPDSGKKR